MKVSVKCDPIGDNGHIKATVYKLNGAGSAVEVHCQEIDPEIESERQGFGANAAEKLDDPSAAKGIAGQIVGQLTEIRAAIAARGKGPLRRNVYRRTLEKISNVIDRTTTQKKKNRRGEEEEKEIPIRHYRSITEIANEVYEKTGGWPKRASGCLFALDVERKPEDFPEAGAIRWIGRTPDLFSFIGQTCVIRWARGDVTDRDTNDILNPHPKDDLLSHFKANAKPAYRAIEILPHFPPVDGLFYLPWIPPSIKSSGIIETPLQKLINKFNPDTELDRSLMFAALMTLGWGGPPGARPAFVFASDWVGRGQGKTSTAVVLADIWGGHIEIGAHEDWDKVRGRLLADESLAKRAVLIDNVDGKLHGSDLERTITARIIDGWKPYHGQASRPNLLTFLITSNTPQLSQDVSERSICIKLGEQKHTEDFLSWAWDFVPKNRADIIGEILEILGERPECEIENKNRDRWGAWQNAILTRFENGNELAAEIIARRPGMDSDLDDADEIAAAVNGLVQKSIGYETHVLKITRKQLQDQLIAMGIIEKTMHPKAVTTFVRKRLGRGGLNCLKYRKSNGERHWIYTGKDADPNDEPEVLL